MTRTASEITAANVLDALREHGPCTSSRVRTLLQLAGHDVTMAQVRPLIDELVGAGEVLELRRRTHRWNTSGDYVVVYELA